MPTKGTLTYYSMLNITKAFLLVRGYDLETATEYHGLSLNPNDNVKLTIAGNSNGNGINIFHSFAKELRYTVQPGSKLSLTEMVSNLPEIHELTYNLGLLNKKKRKFLPIQIEFISNSKRWSKLSYRLYYSKSHKSNYQTDKLNSSKIKEIISKEDLDAEDLEVYRSNQIRSLTHNSDRSWCSNYSELCKEIEELKVHLMLTRQGYKYYLDLQPDKYNPLIYSFALMFYIGSVARYRPTLNESILEGKYKAIISETMKSTPKQYLYHLTGLITNKICAIPMANLD